MRITGIEKLLPSCNKHWMLLGMDMDDKFMNHLFLIDL